MVSLQASSFSTGDSLVAPREWDRPEAGQPQRQLALHCGVRGTGAWKMTAESLSVSQGSAGRNDEVHAAAAADTQRGRTRPNNAENICISLIR